MDEITLAKALTDIKTSKPKAKGIVMQETSETPTLGPIDSSQQPSKAKDKGKAKMIELEKPLKMKDQIIIDEERGELTIEEKSRLFVKLMDKRKKYFARHKAEKIRSKPPTKTQKRNQMCTYLKNMENYKHKLVKGSEKAAECSSKRAESKLEQEDDKRQSIEEENESAEHKRCLEIIPDNEDDVTIEATPLSFNSPTIIDYKIYKEGRKIFFKIIRANSNSQNYLTFRKMFKNFNKEDLEVLWSIVKARFKKTKPVDDMENLLFQTLKIMFLHHVDHNIWKYQQGSAKVLNWKLFDSYEVYYVRTQNMVYYLLVQKMYPFTRNILHQMWNDVRLQVNYEVEMAYDLLRLIRGFGINNEDLATGDEGLATGDEGPSTRVESLGLGGDAAVPEEPKRPERVSALRQPSLTTWIDPEDGIAYINVPAYPPLAPPAQTSPSPKWSSGSLPVSPAPSIVPLPISSPMKPLSVPSSVASPVTEDISPALFKRYDRDIWELFTRSGVVRVEIFSQRYSFRSLDHEQERVAMTFRAIWRPVLTLESWVGQTDAQRAAVWHAISDTHMENRELQLQIIEERCTQLDLVEIVDIMRKGHEPKGHV
nr:hypothetical protein [Tanacetum cinerariifolium]